MNSLFFTNLIIIIFLSNSYENNIFKITTIYQAIFLLIFSIIFIFTILFIMWFFRKDIFEIYDNNRFDWFLFFILISIILIFICAILASITFMIVSIKYIIHY